MQSAYEIKKQICEIGMRLYNKGFVAANDGCISVRSGNEVFITPADVSKGYMTNDMILRVDLDGKKLEGKYDVPADLSLHLSIYRDRADVNAVVHANPPTSTAYAVCNVALDRHLTPEASMEIGTVPVCVYGCPTSEAACKSIAPYLQNHDAFLLQNRGVLAVSETLNKAYFMVERVEHFAKVSILASQIGNPLELPCDELEKLMELRKTFGMPGRHPGCANCKNRGTAKCHLKQNDPTPTPESPHGDLVSQIALQVLEGFKK